MSATPEILITNFDVARLLGGDPLGAGADGRAYALTTTENWRGANTHLAEAVDAGEMEHVPIRREHLIGVLCGLEVLADAFDVNGREQTVTIRKYTLDELRAATADAVAPLSEAQLVDLTRNLDPR